MVTGGATTETGVAGVDIGRELKDTLGRVKQVADAAAVGTLMRTIAGETDGPSRDEVDVAGKTIGIAKDITAMQTEREEAARKEAEYWRLRAQEAEEAAKAKRSESKQEELGAMGAMATIFSSMLKESRENQGEMTRLVLELLKEQRQGGTADPVTQNLAQLGLQVLQGQSQRRPVDDLKEAVDTLKAVGVPVGQQAAGNVVDLDRYRFMHQMNMDMERFALEKAKVLGEIEAGNTRSKQLTDVLQSIGAAVASRQNGTPQNAPEGTQGTALQRWRCQNTLGDGDEKCGYVTMLSERPPDDQYQCPKCKKTVQLPRTNG